MVVQGFDYKPIACAFQKGARKLEVFSSATMMYLSFPPPP